MDDFRILIIQTGGTIDKDYPKRKGGYAFEICDSGARALLDKVRPSFPYRLVTACREDSQDLTQQHWSQILEACSEAEEKFVMITHGTDTILQTAALLAKHLRISQREAQTLTSDHSPTLHDKTSQSANTQSSTTDQSGSSLAEMTSKVHPESIEFRQKPHGSGEGCVSHSGIDKTVVLTGAFLPERFKDTDADFNVGVVVGAMQGGLNPGVYVSLAGRVWPWDKVTRSDSGQYVTLQN